MLEETLFLESLLEAPCYAKDLDRVRIKLDQNELPVDWPDEAKQEILDKLKKENWNVYTDPFHESFHERFSRFLNLDPQKVLTGQGANYLLTIVMDAFCKKRKLVIPSPAFSLYAMHAAYQGYRILTWKLDADLQYDFQGLRSILDKDSEVMVLFDSPNNPTGSFLAREELTRLLADYRTTLFVADEAYNNFTDHHYDALIQGDMDNFISIRTFSKSYGASAIRFAYMIGPSRLMQHLKKLRLPFNLNLFSVLAMDYLIQSRELQDYFEQKTRWIRSERSRCLERFKDSLPKDFTVYPSEANFHLVRAPDDEQARTLYQELLQKNILVRPVLKSVPGGLRITVGSEQENDALFTALSE